MKKNGKTVLVLLLLFLSGGAIFALSHFLNRIPPNDENLAGNTGGNLYNKGLFCQSGEKVYFSNSYDQGSLYSMNADESEIRKLVNAPVFSINAGGNYLYYCTDGSKSGGSGLGYIRATTGLHRCKTNGSSPVRLTSSVVVTAALCGNHLYYQNYNNQDFTRLYKIKTDGSEDRQIADYVINPSSYTGGMIYFAGTRQDHNLYGLTTASDSIAPVMEGNMYQPVYEDSYIYYMDLDQNYRLCRRSLTEGSQAETLTAHRVDTFNVSGGIIFYQKNHKTEPALYRMASDGSNPELVAQGNYSNINMTSQYAYYYLFGNDITIYRTPLYGYPESVIFTGARDGVPSK